MCNKSKKYYWEFTVDSFLFLILTRINHLLLTLWPTRKLKKTTRCTLTKGTKMPRSIIVCWHCWGWCGSYQMTPSLTWIVDKENTISGSKIWRRRKGTFFCNIIKNLPRSAGNCGNWIRSHKCIFDAPPPFFRELEMMTMIVISSWQVCKWAVAQKWKKKPTLSNLLVALVKRHNQTMNGEHKVSK